MLDFLRVEGMRRSRRDANLKRLLLLNDFEFPKARRTRAIRSCLTRKIDEKTYSSDDMAQIADRPSSKEAIGMMTMAGTKWKIIIYPVAHTSSAWVDWLGANKFTWLPEVTKKAHISIHKNDEGQQLTALLRRHPTDTTCSCKEEQVSKVSSSPRNTILTRS